MHEFFGGQDNIKSIWWPGEVSQSIGDGTCDKITVVMEFGQMAGVPWFACWKDGKIIQKHNAALVESVIFK